jgi:large subunit ribosomal protein L10
MEKKLKEKIVDRLNKSFKEAEGVVVTHYLGLNTSELTELRVRVNKAGANFCVAKNSLIKLALKDTDYKGLESYFKGPTALVFSKDPVAGIKVIKKYTDDNEKLKVVKASLNEKVIDEAEFNTLSQLPSLDEIRAEIAGYLVAPHQQLVRVINGAGSELANVLNNFAKKEG